MKMSNFEGKHSPGYRQMICKWENKINQQKGSIDLILE